MAVIGLWLRDDSILTDSRCMTDWSWWVNLGVALCQWQNPPFVKRVIFPSKWRKPFSLALQQTKKKNWFYPTNSAATATSKTSQAEMIIQMFLPHISFLESLSLADIQQWAIQVRPELLSLALDDAPALELLWLSPSLADPDPYTMTWCDDVGTSDRRNDLNE